jgi:DNA invertase Pin-like site-specific DNA recombinase
MFVGYARVSTSEQNLDLQADALTQAGCEKLFTDQMSAAPRPSDPTSRKHPPSCAPATP